MKLDAALPIIRALADGVNPITGESYPDTSPYAEQRTLRALYTAHDVMQTAWEKEKYGDVSPICEHFGVDVETWDELSALAKDALKAAYDKARA